MRNNPIKDKSFSFALKAIIAYKNLQLKKEFILSKQFIHSATSIGANIEEGIQTQNKRGFIHKLNISQKESFETDYLIRLLRDADYLEKQIATKLLKDCEEIQKIITAILKTVKNNFRCLVIHEVMIINHLTFTIKH